MANVKITDLTEIAATDVAAVDVVPIVDIDQDETKKFLFQMSHLSMTL